MELYRVSWYGKVEGSLVNRVRSTAGGYEWLSKQFDSKREALEFYLERLEEHDGTTIRKPILERGVVRWDKVI